MKHGFTLLETLVVVLIIGILASIALPYYQHAVESSRMTEVVVAWGRYKNFAGGHDFSPKQVEQITQKLAKANLKHFSAELICPPKETNELCWEAQFTRQNSSLEYKLITTRNFANLACVGLNSAGENFCESQSKQETPEIINGEQVYPIR